MKINEILSSAMNLPMVLAGLLILYFSFGVSFVAPRITKFLEFRGWIQSNGSMGGTPPLVEMLCYIVPFLLAFILVVVFSLVPMSRSLNNWSKELKEFLKTQGSLRAATVDESYQSPVLSFTGSAVTGEVGKAFVPQGIIELGGSEGSKIFFQKIYYRSYIERLVKTTTSSKTSETHDVSQISIVFEFQFNRPLGNFYLSQYVLDKPPFSFTLMAKPLNIYSNKQEFLTPLDTVSKDWAKKWTALLNREQGHSSLDIGAPLEVINSWNASLESTTLRVYYPVGLLVKPETRSEIFNLMMQASQDFKTRLQALTVP